MSTIDDLRTALTFLRKGDLRAALDELAVPARAAAVREAVERRVRRTWMRYALRGVRQNDAHDRLDLAYKVRDPWHMESDTERHRFVETNRIIEEHLGDHFDRILEIGCGEGHQSEHLLRLGDHLTGLDVSPTAIERARHRLPDADLIAGDLFAQPWLDDTGRFDLVTACEVIYYMSDMPGFLRAIDRLGHACLVTYFAPAARKVDQHIQRMPGVEQTRFGHGDTEWIAAWWPGLAART